MVRANLGIAGSISPCNSACGTDTLPFVPTCSPSSRTLRTRASRCRESTSLSSSFAISLSSKTAMSETLEIPKWAHTFSHTAPSCASANSLVIAVSNRIDPPPPANTCDLEPASLRAAACIGVAAVTTGCSWSFCCSLIQPLTSLLNLGSRYLKISISKSSGSRSSRSWRHLTLPRSWHSFTIIAADIPLAIIHSLSEESSNSIPS
mmetsp:Transcript_78902/g.127945  ORF Transcript_78902/g.127945 Transcript_78902/m.127945 type:complete len:206 (-) Transcript_78902:286-903(-)